MKKLILILLYLLPLYLYSQDIKYARKVVDTLTSKSMHGRGYVNKGDKIAADYISNQFKEFGLMNFKKSYFQTFSFDVNTFPSDMFLKINDKVLIPGKDYLVDPKSSSGKGTKPIIHIEEKKLTWEVSMTNDAQPKFIVLKKSLPDSIKTISYNIKSVLLKKYQSQNIIGFVKGTLQPDSFLVFTAHYDHLGQMGSETYFPGANDNSSGIAMLLNLIEYYSKHPSKYSICFIAFSGEEAGLLGSHYYVEHPLFPLSNIKFLVNLDLLGTGEDGMMVVNGAVFDDEYQRLISINSKNHYLKDIPKRPKAANSDHYFFTESGVRSFFFYTLGGIAAYHDIYDKPETLPLTKFEDVFRLIRDFVETF